MHYYIAIDGGGTSTRGGLYDSSRSLLKEAETGPSNPVAYGVETCVGVLAGLVRQLHPTVDNLETVAAGVSGIREAPLRGVVAQSLANELRGPRVIVTDDLRPVLFANAGTGPATLAIAGTGSSVLAQDGNGHAMLVGGRGAVIGDEGSAYRLVVCALQSCAHAIDGLGPQTGLVDALVEATEVAGFEEMPAWLSRTSKQGIADLARIVLRTAEQGDAVAERCVMDEAKHLAGQVAAARTRLALPAEAPVFLHGGLLRGSELYRSSFERLLSLSIAGVTIRVPEFQGHRAVLEVALAQELPATVPAAIASAAQPESLPPTERRGDASASLDKLGAMEIVRAMNREDRRAAEAVGESAAAIAQAIEAAAKALRTGGRIIYMGAGTSGRLGVLDASECPPTFGVPPERVVGLMAGGDRALRESSLDGAEDDTGMAVRDLAAQNPPVGENDVVIGIAASGTTPYVRSGLEAASRAGARTVLLCCNPACRDGADIVIALATGPEALPGSTRLKAGTATKMAINMISTGAMALSGRVYEGYMVGMKPVNAKLQRRAVRILSALTELDDEAGKKLLEEAGGRIPVAVLMARLRLEAEAAERRWLEAGEDLRAALQAR